MTLRVRRAASREREVAGVERGAHRSEIRPADEDAHRGGAPQQSGPIRIFERVEACGEFVVSPVQRRAENGARIAVARDDEIRSVAREDRRLRAGRAMLARRGGRRPKAGEESVDHLGRYVATRRSDKRRYAGSGRVKSDGSPAS